MNCPVGGESWRVRNFLWLVALLALIAASARWLSVPPPQPAEEKLGFSWQEWLVAPRLVFVVSGDRSQVAAFFSGASPPDHEPARVPAGPWVSRLCGELEKEMEAALKEPCRGQKSFELTLIRGSQGRTVEIGTYAGPAQARIVDLISCQSQIARVRREMLLELADPTHLKH